MTMEGHGIDTVLDIGANRGQTRDMLRQARFKGEIISVEPLPALQDELQKKARKDKRWRVLPPLALGDKNGECEINVSSSSDMSSLLPASDALMKALPKTQVVETAKIPMKTLDALYEELGLAGKRVFVKIDTQGYEMAILRNANVALAKIAGIQVEMSLFEIYKGEALFDEIVAFLKDKGFTPHMLIETNFSKKLNRQLQVDGIFYRDQA